MTEQQPTPPADTPEDPARDWRRHLPLLRRVRAGLVLLGLAGLWFAMFLAWTDVFGSDGIFDAAIVVITIALALVSALWLASLRYSRLQHALLPLDAGIIVGGIVFAVGARGVEVDTPDDAAAIAVVLGVITTIVIAVVARLLEGRRTQPLWIGALVALAVVTGIAIPAVADQLSGVSPGYNESVPAYASILSRVNADGDVLLGRTATMHLDAAYVEDQFGGYGATSGTVVEGPDGTTVVAGGVVDPGSDPSTPLATPTSSGSLAVAAPRLVARDGGDLELRFPELPKGDAVLHARVEAGGCTDAVAATSPKFAPEVFTIKAGAASAAFSLQKLKLADLQLGDRLHVAVGTGGALAPVRCVDLLETTMPLLAQNGLLAFGHDCLVPLHLDPAAQRQLTPASFQDRSCATKLEQLADLTHTNVVRTMESAQGLASCIQTNDGVDMDIRQLAGGSFVVEPHDPADRANLTGQCGTPDGSGMIDPAEAMASAEVPTAPTAPTAPAPVDVVVN
jgi:hypothetical protein